MTTPIAALPNEILQYIFVNVSPQHLCNNCSRVSKSWCAVVALPATWKKPLLAKNGIKYEDACNMFTLFRGTWATFGRLLVNPTADLLREYPQIDAMIYRDIRLCKELVYRNAENRDNYPFNIEIIDKCTIDGFVKLVCHNTKFVRSECAENLCIKTINYDTSSEFIAIIAGGLFCQNNFASQLITKLMAVYKVNPTSTDANRIVQFLGYVLSHVPLCDTIAASGSNTFAPEFEASLEVLSPEHHKILIEAFSNRIKVMLESNKTLAQYCFQGSRYPNVLEANVLKPKISINQTDKIWDIPEKILAMEMTLKTHELMRKCEIIDQLFGPARPASVNTAIDNFNLVNGYIVKQILDGETAKIRAKRITYIIKLCGCLVDLGNTNDAMAITSGLNHGSLHRLKVTWSEVSKSTMQLLDSFSNLLTRLHNHAHLREFCLKRYENNQPQVAFLGLYLTDIVFMKSVPGTIPPPHFSMSICTKLLKIGSNFNKTLIPCYNFKSVPWLRALISGWEFTMNDDELYTASYKAEPRKIL